MRGLKLWIFQDRTLDSELLTRHYLRMLYLWIVTLIWAFSFSFIGVYLSGQVDTYLMVLIRLGLATLVFLPFVLRTRVAPRKAVSLMGIGAIQLGVMYLFYYNSFLLLTVPEVLLFTIFTPLYVTLLHDLLARRFSPHFLFSALIAVAGTAVMRWGGLTQEYWVGFLVVQGSNLCFASGQVAYKRLFKEPSSEPQYATFGYFFIGASLVGIIAYALLGEAKWPTTDLQWGLLIWLGVGASGLGYFLWNYGASQVNSGTLAVMNNALVPAGLIVNVYIWNREVDFVRLSLGGAMIVGALVYALRAKSP